MVGESREEERGGGHSLLSVNTDQSVLGSPDDSDSDSQRSSYLRQLEPTNPNRMKLVAVGLSELSKNNTAISHVNTGRISLWLSSTAPAQCQSDVGQRCTVPPPPLYSSSCTPETVSL